MYIPGHMGEQQAVACDQPHERFSLFAAKKEFKSRKNQLKYTILLFVLSIMQNYLLAI